MRMGWRRELVPTVGAVIGVALGCLAVAGCSDGADDPVTLPPNTPSPSPEPPPSSPSATPSESAEPTPTTSLLLPDEHVESVDAFVVEFFTALNAAKDTGDFAAYDALYLPQCTGCLELRTELEEWLANGQTVEGGDWVILQQSSNQFPDGSNAAADVFAFRSEAQINGDSESDSATQPVSALQWFQFGMLANEPWVIEDMGFSAP